MTLTGISLALPPVHQPDAVVDQAAPVQNLWYTVLAASGNVRIIGIGSRIEVADETIQVEITIDGETYTANNAHTAGATRYGQASIEENQFEFIMAATQTAQLARAFLIEGRNVRVRVRKTTALGAGNLKCTVAWAAW